MQITKGSVVATLDCLGQLVIHKVAMALEEGERNGGREEFMGEEGWGDQKGQD